MNLKTSVASGLSLFDRCCFIHSDWHSTYLIELHKFVLKNQTVVI